MDRIGDSPLRARLARPADDGIRSRDRGMYRIRVWEPQPFVIAAIAVVPLDASAGTALRLGRGVLVEGWPA
jgi:hypothetical protein